eukprot:scaffold47953_cov73-Phaeocystis_antarctica.AAC.5
MPYRRSTFQCDAAASTRTSVRRLNDDLDGRVLASTQSSSGPFGSASSTRARASVYTSTDCRCRGSPRGDSRSISPFTSFMPAKLYLYVVSISSFTSFMPVSTRTIPHSGQPAVTALPVGAEIQNLRRGRASCYWTRPEQPLELVGPRRLVGRVHRVRLGRRRHVRVPALALVLCTGHRPSQHDHNESACACACAAASDTSAPCRAWWRAPVGGGRVTLLGRQAEAAVARVRPEWRHAVVATLPVAPPGLPWFVLNNLARLAAREATTRCDTLAEELVDADVRPVHAAQHRAGVQQRRHVPAARAHLGE